MRPAATSSVRTDFTGTERIAEAGAPVEVRIETANVPNAIVVPAAALFQDQGVEQYHVFVIGPDGKAHRTNVKVGLRDRDRVQVTDGIKVGRPGHHFGRLRALRRPRRARGAGKSMTRQQLDARSAVGAGGKRARRRYWRGRFRAQCFPR